MHKEQDTQQSIVAEPGLTRERWFAAAIVAAFVLTALLFGGVANSLPVYAVAYAYVAWKGTQEDLKRWRRCSLPAWGAVMALWAFQAASITIAYGV